VPLALPNLSALNKQLSTVGSTVKSVGPSLFSATQSPGPVSPQLTSMMRDAFDTGVRPQMSLQNTGLGASWANTGLNANTLGLPSSQTSTGPYNPFYNSGQQGDGRQSGSLGEFSGGKAMLNNYDAAFASAGAQYGIDPNWLKSIAAIEGHYDNSIDPYGAVGIMGIMPGGYGSLEAQHPGWRNDPAQNIALGAAILASKIRENGGTIEGGIQGYLGWGTDAYGTTPGAYLGRVSDYYQELQQGGGQFSGGTVAPINGQWGGNATGNNIVDIAKQFLGVAYSWGSIPGKGQDPWTTGWDCSGMTYWLDQNYGSGSLPQGSHYQYQYAQQTGQLFTDLSQLQPGDLVFIDTGWMGGGGSELNRAGHVGIYIGNGQLISAANPNMGTVISPLSGYGNVLGAMHGTWSGPSGGGSYGGTGSSTPTSRQSIYRNFYGRG
jgi:hypothetical protein